MYFFLGTEVREKYKQFLYRVKRSAYLNIIINNYLILDFCRDLLRCNALSRSVET